MFQKIIDLKTDDILCLQGDLQTDLYYIKQGLLMACVRKGTQITPVAYLRDGEFIGELSFFDNTARSADIIALEPTRLVHIPQAELKKQMPSWLLKSARFMTKKIRLYNTIIQNKGLKKSNVDGIKPLKPEKQRHYFHLIQQKSINDTE
jgi:CRP/FNR family cyclic AMP-dependent transcriptional regulator